MAEQLTQDQTMELVRSQYPEYLAILSKPGVQDALFQAVQNNWTPARLQAALQATEYYRTTSNVDRTWDILSTVDPQTAAQRVDIYRRKIESLEQQTGVQLTQEQADPILKDAAANQYSDAELRFNFITRGPGGSATSGGEVATQAAQVHTLASDYGVPLSDQAAIDWANKLASGAVDQNGVKGYMIQQAQSLYPGLKGALDSGVTVRQYADPYAQIAARELNINPQEFNLSNTKWSAALSQVDQAGNKVPMSLDQWQSKIRTDPQYGYDQTQNGQAAAATLTTALAQKMGAL